MSALAEKPLVAECRNCRRTIPGKPYYMGGHAPYDPVTRQPWRSNHYGGWVCSQQCDWKAALELEQTMPGHGIQQRSPGCYTHAQLERKWEQSA